MMGISSEQRHLSAATDHLAPSLGADGEWGSVGGIAVRDSLVRGSLEGAMDLLGAMDVKAVAGTLREAGFPVAVEAIARGRDVVLGRARADLVAAADLGVDGFGLAAAKGFAAKEMKVMSAMDNPSAGFAGDRAAAAAIQAVMRSSAVTIGLLGDAVPGARGALLMVAGQAVRAGVQGFGFEGVPGKYAVSLSMGDVLDLHRDAVQSVAVESARTALGVWVAGGKVDTVSEWVPDSVQRLLHGSVSLAAAEVLVSQIESGAIARHAGNIGTHEFTRLLAAQGFDVDALTVEQQAQEQDLVLVQPNRERGQYVGPVVGLDHRAALVKFNKDSAVELPFAELAGEQARPVMGDRVRMGFKAGVLAVGVEQRPGREGAGR